MKYCKVRKFVLAYNEFLEFLEAIIPEVSIASMEIRLDNINLHLRQYEESNKRFRNLNVQVSFTQWNGLETVILEQWQNPNAPFYYTRQDLCL